MNEEDEKGLWDARSGLRTSLGLGFEVGANTLLDIFSFIPPAQVAGGTFINYLAQKIRGGEISKGELTAAGLTSLIPGGTQARALTRGGRFTRNVAKGSLAGGITTTSMSLVDEGELPSFGEFATGVTGGGLLGGAFDLAPAAFTGRLGTEVSEIAGDTGFFLKQLRRKVQGGDLIFDPEIYYGPGFGAGTVGAAKPNNNWSLSEGVDPIKNQVLVAELNNPKIERWLTGSTRTISKRNANFIQEIANDKDFMSLMAPKFTELKQKYPHLVKQIGEKETLLIRWHHVNPSKGGIDLYKGLTNPTDRMELNKYLIDEVGIYSGNHPLNNRGLSIDVHDQIHSWLGQRLGLRADTLKYKWAQELGIDVGELSPGKGFMADHLVLSKQGNQAWDNFFSTLTVKQRKPFFKEYGELIKESDQILEDLMKQYDALYAMPEGYQAVIPDEVLLEFLDNIPTDGSRLLQKNIRNIVEQVNREMPRGTLDIINEAGEIRRIDLESKLYKRMQEVRRLLDEAKDLRTKRSLKAELKNLEEGIYQEVIDFKTVQKQAGWKKRMEQEKLRREGKK